MTPCTFVDGYRRLKETCCMLLRRRFQDCRRYVKKLRHYTTGQSLICPGGWNFQNLQSVGARGLQSCQPHAPAAFTPQEKSLVLICVTGWVNPRATMRPEGLKQRKIPITPSGIEPATFRLVAQCFNQLRHLLPLPPHRRYSFVQYFS